MIFFRLLCSKLACLLLETDYSSGLVKPLAGEHRVKSKAITERVLMVQN
jgi:hypothetical protein